MDRNTPKSTNATNEKKSCKKSHIHLKHCYCTRVTSFIIKSIICMKSKINFNYKNRSHENWQHHL